MKVAVEEIGACKRRLQVEEASDVVSKAWEKAFNRVQKEAKLPGFRKGKVPRGMIKLHFSDDVRQEVARHPFPTCTARRCRRRSSSRWRSPTSRK